MRPSLRGGVHHVDPAAAALRRAALGAVLQRHAAEPLRVPLLLLVPVPLGADHVLPDLARLARRRAQGSGVMGGTINWTALGVFVFFFALVTVMGFWAARWKRG